MSKLLRLSLLFTLVYSSTLAQKDTIPAGHSTVTDSLHHPPAPTGYQDTALRIINLNPYFTIHADSVLIYDFVINREAKDYFWYLQNSPVGVRIDRSTGVLYVKADKGLFKSGRLKYDVPYQVKLVVQNLRNPTDKLDTSFTLLFYSTEIAVSKLKPTTSPIINVEEGDLVQFKVQCDDGSFPIEQITLNTSMPISGFTPVRKCNDEFRWQVPFDIFRENDTARVRTVIIDFIGSDKFFNRDTASIRINIRPGINYPLRNDLHKRIATEFYKHILYLKLSFYIVSKNVKTVKKTRTAFDITGSATALAGTVISTTAERGSSTESVGKILPSVGLTLVPIKEAAAPNNVQQQNTATQLRAEVKRLEYVLSENQLNGDRDPEVLAKTKRLQDELKKSRLQFLDLPPLDVNDKDMEAVADRYFNDPKVIKKYRIKVK
jgi:hypothetical protein